MTQVTLRIEDELLARVDALDGTNRQEKLLGVIEQGIELRPGLKAVLLSESQIASLDQTAARLGLTREAAIHRFLSERIRREFVEERQRQTHLPGRLRPA